VLAAEVRLRPARQEMTWLQPPNSSSNASLKLKREAADEEKGDPGHPEVERRREVPEGLGSPWRIRRP